MSNFWQWQFKVYTDIRGVPWRRGVKRVGLSKMAIFSKSVGCPLGQGCGLGLDVSVSRRSTSRLGLVSESAQRLGLVSVSDLCVSDLV